MGRCKAKLISAVLCCLLVLGAAIPARAEGELQLASQAAVLMDADTGTVLYEKNMHEPLYPASITKLMTALLALQHLEPEQVLTVSQTAVNAVPRTSSHISLVAGEKLTVEEAMYAIGMESANDAANVLAEAVAGSLEAFAAQMTETAQKLGALNTHFTNANGLPLGSGADNAYRKIIPLDCALTLRLLNMTMPDSSSLTTHILTAPAADLVNKGTMAELVAGLELLHYQSPHLRHEMFYWTRQTKNSLAEITFQFASIIAPIISCFSRN